MNNPYNAPGADLSQHQSGAGTYDPEVFAVNGRIGRLRYLAYSVLLGLLSMVVVFIVAAIGGVIAALTKSQTLMMVMIFLAYIPVLAVTFILAKRRLNDMDYSGWLSLLTLIPFVGILVYLWLIFGSGDAEANKYGPPPSANSGLVIAGACIMPLFLVAIIGILAAVAIPAYQQYTLKAQAAKALREAPPAQYQQ